MPCYEHLRRYQGAKKRCAHCGRKFGPGEVVSVEGGARERVFCYSDAGGGCVIVYNFRKGRRDKVIFVRPQRMAGCAQADQRAPNYHRGYVPVAGARGRQPASMETDDGTASILE